MCVGHRRVILPDIVSQPTDIVRAHIAAFIAEETERSASFLDDHVVFDWTRIGILNPAGYGVDGVIKATLHYRAAFEDYGWQIEELTDLGSGQVLAQVGETARGKGSGVPVERSISVLYTVIERKIARITAFTSVGAAREAVGNSADA